MTEPPAQDAIQFWLETKLRDALDDPANILETLGVLKVSLEAGQDYRAAMRVALCSFVFHAFAIEPPDTTEPRTDPRP